MGYYDPPEVTEGNYIAGPCNGYLSDVKVQPPDLIAQFGTVIWQLEHGTVQQACFILGRIGAECTDMPVAEEVKCNFDGGSVEGTFSGGRRYYSVDWTCPVCGTEHSEDREADDDDPDL